MKMAHRCVYMSKGEFVTDEFGVAYPIHDAFTLVVAGEEKFKKWYRQEVSRLKRVRQRQLGRSFPYRPAYRKKKTKGRFGALVPKAPPPKVQRLPRQAPNEKLPAGPSRRRRAAPSRKDRYRIGWNNHFSIKPLDAHRRPYQRWPRD